MDRDDARVVEAGQRARLLLHARTGPVIAELTRVHQLERDLTLELGIVGSVDDAHPAATEELAHPVAANSRRLEVG